MRIDDIAATSAVVALTALLAGTVAAQPVTVVCESKNYRNEECAVPSGPVVLVRQLSTPPGDCIQGRTWGFNSWNNVIWVSNGCRAEFHAGYGAAQRPVPASGMTVVCESREYRNEECAVDGGPVVLVRQLSTPPGDCIEGRTWGYNSYSNMIWVSNGCRAEFRVGYAVPQRPPPQQGAIVTCESQNYRNEECLVPGGPVALVRQLSTPPGDCIEGQTWGFNSRSNTIWVTNGCRAEFRIGYGGNMRPVPAPVMTVTCESIDYRDAECTVASGPVALIRQLSTPPGNCIEGQTWGFNGYNNTIWVNSGCRAQFRAGGR